MTGRKELLSQLEYYDDIYDDDAQNNVHDNLNTELDKLHLPLELLCYFYVSTIFLAAKNPLVYFQLVTPLISGGLPLVAFDRFV